MAYFPSTSILVVDESASARLIVRSVLSRIGFSDVQEARTGAEALKRLTAKSHGLVICDWSTEPTGGVNLLRAIRATDAFSTTRVLVLSSDYSWGAQTTARSEGADGFVVKPFVTRKFQAAVHEALAARQRAPAPSSYVVDRSLVPRAREG